MSLLEIKAQKRDITVNGTKVDVFGWSAHAIADLLSLYRDDIQDVVKTFKEAAAEGKSFQQIIAGADTRLLDALSHSVIPTAVVWATRFPRTSTEEIVKAEAVVRDLPFTTQLVFLKNAYDLTFPEGVQDFLTALGLAVEQGESATK